MFDVEEFRDFASIFGWTKRSGIEGTGGLYLDESKAKILITKIDRLEDYFFDVINKLDNDKHGNAIAFYNNKLTSIKNTYLEKNVNNQIELFENNICEIRKRNSDYRRIKEKARIEEVSESEDFNKYLAKEFVKIYDNCSQYYTYKVNFIANFEDKIRGYMLYDTLFDILNKGKIQNKENTKKTIPQYALFYYYIQASKEFPLFETDQRGKVKSIEELLLKAEIKTTPKYFQLKYNLINNHKSNRIALNQVKNILYVINNMLNDYPKAKEIAQSEYNLAINRNR